MSLPPGTRITNQIAHDICVRDAAAATIDGSIASLGKNYVVTLQAIGCQDGATIAQAQVQADGKEQVLNAIGTAATAMRARLGESRNSIQRLNRPLEQATTSSLQALQLLTTGRAELTQGRFLSAAPWFERAIALDPNFATAYRHLSIVYNNAGNSEREAEYNSKAFALIDRVSERERYAIAAGYYGSSQELDKALDTYRLGIGNYPRDWGFRNDFSQNLNNMGQFEEGLKEGQVAAELQPSAEPPYRRLMDAYMCLGRIDEAKKVAEQVRSLGIDGARIHQRFLEIAYIEDDSTAAARETQWFAGKRGGVRQLWLAGRLSQCSWPAPRVEHVVQAGCGDGAGPRVHGCRRGLRRSGCARRRAGGQLRYRAPPRASGAGTRDVRRCGAGGKARGCDVQAFSKRNYLD